MEDVSRYRLVPRGAFHFGERGVGLEATTETYPSDSLFSSVCAAVRELDGADALQHLLAGFQHGDPPFLLSSCFPWAGEQGREVVWFFPRPFLPWPGGEAPRVAAEVPPEGAAAEAKAFKKLRYVSAGVLRSYLTPAPLEGVVPLHQGPCGAPLRNWPSSHTRRPAARRAQSSASGPRTRPPG